MRSRKSTPRTPLWGPWNPEHNSRIGSAWMAPEPLERWCWPSTMCRLRMRWSLFVLSKVWRKEPGRDVQTWRFLVRQVHTRSSPQFYMRTFDFKNVFTIPEIPNFPTIEGVQTGISVLQESPSKVNELLLVTKCCWVKIIHKITPLVVQIGTCEVKNGYPKPQIIWYKNNTPLLLMLDGELNQHG